MHFSLLYVSEKPNQWAEQACDNYLKRMPPAFAFTQTRINPVKRTKNTPSESAKAQEWQLIQDKLPKQCLLVLLDERGKQYSSQTFSQQLDHWQHQGQDVAFVIAGADGVNTQHRQQANQLIALSHMTLPHEMARVFLVEQLYRAWSILNNHPYHRI